MKISKKILKRWEAHGGNPPMWFDHHLDYPINAWGNDSILHLMSSGEIWELHCSFIWNEKMNNHNNELWYFERHINPYCDQPKSIWQIQIGCESTGEYSQIFSSEYKSLNAIKNSEIIWSTDYPVCNPALCD